MDCANKKKNLEFCNCSYPGCPRKGLCCECIRYHLSLGELPGCFFPKDAEATYNRSIEYFAKVAGNKK